MFVAFFLTPIFVIRQLAFKFLLFINFGFLFQVFFLHEIFFEIRFLLLAFLIHQIFFIIQLRDIEMDCLFRLESLPRKIRLFGTTASILTTDGLLLLHLQKSLTVGLIVGQVLNEHVRVHGHWRIVCGNQLRCRDLPFAGRSCPHATLLSRIVEFIEVVGRQLRIGENRALRIVIQIVDISAIPQQMIEVLTRGALIW